MEGNQSSETTETIETTETAAPSETTETQPLAETTTAEVETPPAYTPNYDYKVYDENKQIDEWARPYIKDKESEDRFRDLFSGAGAVKQMQATRDQQVDEFNTIEKDLTTLRGQLAEASSYVERGDLDGFYKAIGLPVEKVYQHVLDKLNYQNMPAEQQQVHDERITAQRQSHTLEQRLSNMEGQLRTDQVQVRTRELDTAMDNADIKSAAQAFDLRLGEPGAFRDEVVRHAMAEWNITGRDLSAGDAVNAVLNKYGTVAATEGLAQPAAAGAPPVIPNVAGRNVSPARKQQTSLQGLRDKAKALDEEYIRSQGG